jgi:hypothetical protein
VDPDPQHWKKTAIVGIQDPVFFSSQTPDLRFWIQNRVGIKKPNQKNPPKKTQKNPPKKTTKNGVFWVFFGFFKFLIFYEIIQTFLFQTDFL